MTRLSLTLLTFILFPTLPLWAQDAVGPGEPEVDSQAAEEPESEEPLPKPTAAELRQLAGGLGSESFEIRERAQAALRKYARQHPDAVRDALAEDYVESTDPEVRYRLAEVIYDAVVDQMEHSGFLGIIMGQSNVPVDGQMVSSIQVSRVFRNSAAARAGLRSGDQILQVDDMKFDPVAINRQQPFIGASPNLEKFKDYIGGRKQGTEVTLTIQRLVNGKPEVMKLPVELGRRTRELMEPEELQAQDRFFEEWLKKHAEDSEKSGPE